MKKGALFLSALMCLGNLFAQTDSVSRYQDTVINSIDTTHFQAFAGDPAKRKVYQLKPAVDIPVTAVGLGWTLYAFTKIYSKDTSSAEEILALNRNDVAKINRGGIDVYHPEAFNKSNIFFYASMPWPLVLMIDKDIRKDAAKVGFLWLESMSVTGLLYTGSVYFHDKYRPYTYNPDVPMSKRTRGGGRNSFFAGHVALVGTGTFFTAKVFSDYHPHSSLRWVFYGIAAVSTAATGYLRYRAGEHFFTDILIGAGVGTLSGILIPGFHKVRSDKEPKLSFTPYYNGRDKGVAMAYHF
jgi:membrane-associated phospholipid phosphatase